MKGAVFPAGSGLGSVGLPAHPSTRSYTCFRFCFHSSFIICRSKNNHCQILYMMIPFVFLLYTEKTFFVNRANVYILQSNLYFYTFRPVSSTVNRWHKKCNNICNDSNRMIRNENHLLHIFHFCQCTSQNFIFIFRYRLTHENVRHHKQRCYESWKLSWSSTLCNETVTTALTHLHCNSIRLQNKEVKGAILR